MKTKELMERLENLDVNWRRDTDTITLYDDNLRILIEISEDDPYCVEVFEMFHRLPEQKKASIYSLATEYAATPLEERRKPKKYIYQLPIKNNEGNAMYLYKEDGNVIRMDHSPKSFVMENRMYHFSDKEVASYPEDIQKIFQACIKEEVQ